MKSGNEHSQPPSSRWKWTLATPTPLTGSSAGGIHLTYGRSQRDLLTARLAKTKHGSIILRRGLCKSPAGTPSWLETSLAGCRPNLYGSRQEGKTEGSRLHGDSPGLRHADPAQIKVSRGSRAPRLLSQWFGPGQHSLPVRSVRDVA